MFILKKGHQPGVYVPLRALFLVFRIGWPSFVKGNFSSFVSHKVYSHRL